MKKARGYKRLSQESDTSLERQHELIEKYCSEQGFELDKIYNEGKRASGFTTDREKYTELIEDAKAQEFDVLILRDGSRLGRDFMERLDRFGDLTNKWGIEFHTTKHGFVDPNEPMTVLQEVFRAATDQEGKKEEIDKAKKEINRRLDRGYYQGGLPYGMQFDDKKHFLIPGEKFETVQEVLDLREEGTTYEKINEETGVPTGTAHRIVQRREYYEEKAQEAGL